MSEENDTGKHEFNFFLDKQIQQKLLEADELIAAKETALCKNQWTNSKVQIPSSSSANNLANSNSSNVVGTLKNNIPKLVKEKESLRVNISGWCSGPGVVYRKTENDTPVRTRGQQGLRDVLSRDSKFRPQTHSPQDFVFRHYADPRRYIEQYRKEHACYDTTTSSAARSEFLDTRRFYAYNQYSPLAVGAQNNAPQVNSPLPPSYQDTGSATPEKNYSQKKQQQQTPTLQYTNRREQTKQTISASLRPPNVYKLSKSNATSMEKAKTPDPLQESNAHPDREGQTKRAGSARGSASSGVNGVTSQRTSTTTTSDMDRLSARGQKSPALGVPSESTGANHFMGRKLGQVGSGQTRTLDALTCHVPMGGKQISGDPQAVRPSRWGILSSGADCAGQQEARLEQLRRVNRRRKGGQPAAHAPQLTFIREGEEGTDPARSCWAGKGRSYSEGSCEAAAAAAAAAAAHTTLWGYPASHTADSGGEGRAAHGDSVSSNDDSSLQPNGGSSVRTSVGSFNSSSGSGSNNHHQRKPSKATKVKSEDTTTTTTDQRSHHQASVEAPVISTCPPVPPTTVPSHLLEDVNSSLSWRERVWQQQQKTMALAVDDGAGNHSQLLGSRRWAVARRQEELSSVAHARRIKHLIEQSRQRGGVGVGLTSLGRPPLSLEDGAAETGEGLEGQGQLRVEGQQHRRRHKVAGRTPPSTTTSGWNGKGANSEGGGSGFVMASSQPVLPPVRKTRGDGESGGDLQHKPRAAPGDPILGDLLDAQAFFSHGVPLPAAESSSKQQQHRHHPHHHHHHRFTPPDKPPAPALRSVGLSESVASTRDHNPVTLATAAVMGDPPQPRLKYSTAARHRLVGHCSP